MLAGWLEAAHNRSRSWRSFSQPAGRRRRRREKKVPASLSRGALYADQLGSRTVSEQPVLFNLDSIRVRGICRCRRRRFLFSPFARKASADDNKLDRRYFSHFLTAFTFAFSSSFPFPRLSAKAERILDFWFVRSTSLSEVDERIFSELTAHDEQIVAGRLMIIKKLTQVATKRR